MIKRILKTTQRNLQDRVSDAHPLNKRLYVFLLTFLRPLYFTNEWLLINGLKPQHKSTHQSIIFFSVHKSASTLIKNTIIKLIASEKIIPVKICAYLSEKKQEKYFNDPAMMKRVLRTKGFFFTTFHKYYPFPGLDNFKIILVLRDPRDVLTSFYFSVLYNHPLSRQEVAQQRKQYADISIDEFALQRAVGLNAAYTDYCNKLLNKPNVLFLKYEYLIANFRECLEKISGHVGLGNNNNIIDDIVGKTSFEVKKEDPHSFIRNIKAGDHKNKLQPGTIEKLNNIFRDVLIKLKYTID